MRSGNGIDTGLSPSHNCEWLETNGLGDYASATSEGINTRRYHGLLVSNVEHYGRHVLLSTVEDWLVTNAGAWPLSSRHHPGTVYPQGASLLKKFIPGPCPGFVYEAAGYRVTRRVALVKGRHTVLVRYSVERTGKGAENESVTLRVAPLLAFRSYHALTHANMDLQVKTFPVASGVNGFKIQPYNALPALYVQVSGLFDFLPSPEWVNAVEYPVERERGFDCQEDLFSPGLLELHVMPGEDIVVAASTEPIAPAMEGDALETMWEQEMASRPGLGGKRDTLSPLQGFLADRSACFLMKTPGGRSMILAGYPWFGSWGRDTLIALPGVTFLAGRVEEGLEVLRAMAESASDGLIPNTFDSEGRPGGYNSVDASLWFAWACHLMLERLTRLKRSEEAKAFQDLCAPAIYSIIAAYRAGRVPFARVASSGMLEVGTPSTQLTWMDAQVNGVPVTPRYGYPVEIQALWYNTLAVGHHLAKKRGDPDPCPERMLKALQAVFAARFVKEDGSLNDVWRHAEDGGPDGSVRPNQLLAVSLPYAIAPKEDWRAIVDRCTEDLLTPYGLRTLSPDNPAFCPTYGGGSAARDGAYHQGTVWTWLLGPYTEAMLKAVKGETEGGDKGKSRVARAAKSLLDKVTPLFTTHMTEAGLGHMSEIFSATAPYAPDGTIAQAWSEGEALRMLLLVRTAAPEAYKEWEEKISSPVRHGKGGKTK
ncbi:MAG: amylo-alpha-1,6-glucosidase [Desulfovibrionaceae bacterium]|nr:amylo-alpha-1,6-glucosidase [Desulfovibrionaceae bacterium]